MKKYEDEVALNEKDIEEIRREFQDFLTEIPEDYLIERAREIEKELGLDLDDLDEKIS